MGESLDKEIEEAQRLRKQAADLFDKGEKEYKDAEKIEDQLRKIAK